MSSVELKLSTRNPPGFYIRAAKSFFQGLPEKDGKAAKPAVDTVTLTALGNAINAAVTVSRTIEKEGIASVTAIRTKYSDVAGPAKRSANMTIVMKRAGCIHELKGDLKVTTEKTSPISGQKPGTSGLRKKTKEFMGKNYLENFAQSVFSALLSQGVKIEGGTIVISGDGRYYNDKAAQILIKMACAHGVKNIWIGQGGLLSTPAVSAVIRNREGGFVPFGGFILSASHNPGGIDEDFGIKFNCENGGPSPEKVTDLIYKMTTEITEYKTCKGVPDIDINKPGSYTIGGKVRIDVFDCTDDHVALLKKVFDFDAIKALVARPDFTMSYDSMCGVQGPYAKRIMVQELGAPESCLVNADPKEDFGGASSPHHGHADPNLTYAVGLVKKMGLNKKGEKIETGEAIPEFGAAADGDADRNMILGKQWFVSPSDSLAIIVANASVIPYYKDGLNGVARSMPTSCALDRVAEKNKIKCFEVPTGWKFFGNLMDSGDENYFPGKPSYTPFICGEESFGTGGNHVREKDGMWAVLAWLQILASKNKDPKKKLVTVEDICNAHWKKYGRNYYARYDYEGVDKPAAEKMMAGMTEKVESLAGTEIKGMKIKKADVFEYTDPVDSSVSKNQGIRFMFVDGSRIVFRLSGTGVAGATIRLYLEMYVKPNSTDPGLAASAFDVVKPLAEAALELSDLPKLTGRNEPSVIT